jgi:diguanylate cyclase (GGDEF)-like protein
MDDGSSEGNPETARDSLSAALARVAKAFASQRVGAAFPALHKELVRLGMRALTIAAVDERSPDPLRYEFQADAAKPSPEPLDPHTLAFALAADKPRILATTSKDAKAYVLACPIRVAGKDRGFIVVQSDAPIRDDSVDFVEVAAVMAGQQMALSRRGAAESAKDRALALMLEAARVLSAADPDEIFSTVHQLVGRVMDAPLFVGSLVMPETGEFLAVYYADYGRVSMVRAKVPERGPTAEAFRTGKPVLINRPTDWQKYEAINLAGANVPHAPSAIFVPLRLGDAVLGVISIQCRRLNAYTQTETDILTSIAEQVAIAVNGARIAKANERRAADLNLLVEVARAVSSELDLHAVLARIGDQVRRFLDAPVFFAALFEDEGATVDLEYFIEENDEQEPRRYPVERSLLAQVLKTGAPLLIHSAEERDRMPWMPLTQPVRSQSIIAVPMTAGGRVIGAISAQSYEAHAYDRRHVDIMRTIGEQAGVAVRNAQLFERAKDEAYHDALTEVASRRSLEERLNAEVKRADRSRTSVAVLVLDVDDLKGVNASLGRAAGDRALQHVAASARAAVRESDFVGRVGGDEFAIILPEAGSAGAAIVAERVSSDIAGRPVLLDGEASLYVRVSAGWGVYPEGATSREALLTAAIAALKKH